MENHQTEQQSVDTESRPGLYERLAEYAETDYYPFHMPGHKRADLDFPNPYKMDVTEIEGFDNLHHAEGILLEAQERLKKLYQSKKSYYLINGSTCGLLSAIGAVVKPKDRILIARNCHKAVYHAAKIFQLEMNYVYPEWMEYGIQGQIQPHAVQEALQKYEHTKAVVITSPTYEGLVSDISAIAEIVHKYHAYLIIDEAHGAHFSLSSYFPESSVNQGADLVIQSLHKTLPSFTQTAALHLAGGKAVYEKVEEMLGIFQSSSPSYLLMAGIDRCVRIIERSGKQLFEQFHQNLMDFYKGCLQLKCLRVLTEKDYEAYDVPACDPSKIVIHTGNAGINGTQLYFRLLEQFHLQMELYSAQYVLAMTSVMDTKEGLDRLLHALLVIDGELQKAQKQGEGISAAAAQIGPESLLKEIVQSVKKVMEISEIADYNIEDTACEACAGKICAEFIYLYPPGIPMIVPGEVLSEELIRFLGLCRKNGLNVQGTKDRQYRNIRTVATA